MFMQEKKRVGGKKELMFGGDEALFAKVEGAYKEIQIELNELLQEKYLMEAEDKITEEVRRRIQAIKSDSTPTIVKKQGTEEINRKLNEKITGSTNQPTVAEQEVEQVKTDQKAEEVEVKKEPVDEQMERLKKYLKKGK